MYVDALNILAVDISAGMLSAVDDEAFLALGCHAPCHHCPVESCSYYKVVVFVLHHLFTGFCLLFYDILLSIVVMVCFEEYAADAFQLHLCPIGKVLYE